MVIDPQMTALVMLAMDLGMVLLRPHVERIIDAELTEPATTQRWLAAVLDLFTRPLLQSPTEI